MPSRFWRASGNALLPGSHVLGPAGGGGGTTQWDAVKTSSSLTISNGGHTLTQTAGSGTSRSSLATLAKTDGYFEVTIGTQAGLQVGIDDGGIYPSGLDSSFIGANNGSVCYHTGGGGFTGGSQVATYSTFTTGDVIGVCFKGGKVYFSKNGVWQGGSDPSAGTGGITPAGAISSGYPGATTNTVNDSMTANFAAPFIYTVPTGVSAWG